MNKVLILLLGIFITGCTNDISYGSGYDIGHKSGFHQTCKLFYISTSYLYFDIPAHLLGYKAGYQAGIKDGLE